MPDRDPSRGAGVVLDMVRWSAYSAQGLARSRNADAWAARDGGEAVGFAVADGVGALALSPVASAAAAHAAAAWGAGFLGGGSADDLVTTVSEAVGQALRGDTNRGATTLAALALTSDRCIAVTVGDTELLAVADAGDAVRLNELDHVPAQPTMLLAWIDGEIALAPHVIELGESCGRRLCLVTDGVTAALDYATIGALVRDAGDAAAEALVNAARAAGSEDDATAIVIEWPRRSAVD